jgi:hypothetical protein
VRPSATGLFGDPAPTTEAETETSTRTRLPTWLMSVLFAVGFLGLVAAVYWLVPHMTGGGASTKAATPALQNAPKGQAAQENPMQKFIEVAGVRLVQNSKKQTEARFVLVNHATVDAVALSGEVTILGRTQKEGEEPVGRFLFKGVTLGPNESKEASAIVETKLRVYELPDWQMTDARLQLTSP